MSTDAAAAWGALPIATLRAYLASRGCDLRTEGLLERSDVMAKAQATASRLGEGVMHASAALLGVRVAQATGAAPAGADVAAAAEAAATEAAPPTEASEAAQEVSRLSRACSACGMRASDADGVVLSLCARCKGASYCGKACQRSAWPAHKAECAATAHARIMRGAAGGVAAAEAVARARREHDKAAARSGGGGGGGSEDDAASLSAAVMLGGSLHKAGKWAEAEPVLRKALARCQAQLGDAHATTLQCLGSLAITLQTRISVQRARGDKRLVNEAVSLSRAAVAACTHLTGSAESFGSLSQRANLAGLLKGVGRLEAAEAEYAPLLIAAPRVAGPRARLTLQVRCQHAELLGALGRVDAAEAAHRSALADIRAALGSDDPFTLSAICGYAGTLSSSGAHVEAEALYREALASLERVHGAAHPDTHAAASNLAHGLAAAGKGAEAAALLASILSGARLGPLSPDAAAGFRATAASVNAQRRTQAALAAVPATEVAATAERELRAAVARAEPRVAAVVAALDDATAAVIAAAAPGAASAAATRGAARTAPALRVVAALEALAARLPACTAPPRTVSAGLGRSPTSPSRARSWRRRCSSAAATASPALRSPQLRSPWRARGSAPTTR